MTSNALENRPWLLMHVHIRSCVVYLSQGGGELGGGRIESRTRLRAGYCAVVLEISQKLGRFPALESPGRWNMRA